MCALKLSVSNCSILLILVLYCVRITNADDINETKPVRYFDECFSKIFKLTCATEKASQAIDNAIDMDIQLFPGLVFERNNLPLEQSSREIKNGLDRLINSLMRFFDAHSLAVDLGEDEARRRRRRKGYGYLYSSLLGVFGITHAMVLKSLALISGKALMVSKMALMISGIILIKKLFSKEDHYEKQIVQVHALHDEHDRQINAAMYHVRHL